MNRKSVDSENIKSIGYNSLAKILEVQCLNGIYHYFFVPDFIYQGIMTSDSKESFLENNIKGVYQHKIIE